MTDDETLPQADEAANEAPVIRIKPLRPEADRSGSAAHRRGHVLPVAVVLGVAVLSFGLALRADFVGADTAYVETNTGIRSLSNVPAFFGADYWNEPATDGRRAYRPLVELTLAVDHAIWGLRPAGFRLTNLLLHALVAVAVYAVAFQVSRHRVAALVAAALFAAHPVHAEAVNLIKNRGDLMGTLFCLLSWLAFIQMVDRAHARHAAGQQALSGVRGLVVGVAFFILALFSKEIAIALPILLLIYTAALVPVGWRGWAGAQTLVWWVALWGYLALSLAAIKKFAGAITTGTLAGPPESLADLDAAGRALAAVKTIGVYLRLLVFPAGRSTVHEFRPPAGVGAWPVVVTLVALGVLVVVCVAVFRRYRLAAFALAWLPITLLPVSNVVVLRGERAIAEHRLYLPAVGFALLLGAIVGGLARRRIGKTPVFAGAYRVAVVILALVTAAFVVRSATRSAAWERDLTTPAATTAPAERGR